ncbi:MAG: FGGY-family carbohydrate kinase [Paracoccaceae bacterium]
MNKPDVIIGIDAGTSVLKAVAFSLDGRQLAISSVKNDYTISAEGAATQSMPKTWQDCARALRGLTEQIEDLDNRTAAIGVTAQGDGTWLLNSKQEPFTDAWLWLDARAAKTVEQLTKSEAEGDRFHDTGTGLNTCQQGSQLAHMKTHAPELVETASVALHCKDWLYFNLTGELATDPSEASFTFGDFRKRQYSTRVIEALGLTAHRTLLPEIIDGTKITHPLSVEAARQCGLRAGTPVSLGFVDMVMTALGAGVYTGDEGVGCSTIGSTGVHMTAKRAENVRLSPDHTGYVICLPHQNLVAQTQTNMAATLNIDWILDVGADLVAEFVDRPSQKDMIARLEAWLSSTSPGALLYHPYISDAGERGPFLNPYAKANFTGLAGAHRYPDLVRAVVEGLGMAARDCYAAMGNMPQELRLTGGATKSDAFRKILSAALDAPVRVSAREETGAAGCAMMAAVGIGVYPDMKACIDQWVVPLLAKPEEPDEHLAQTYQRLYAAYAETREGLVRPWATLGELAQQKAAP